MSAQQQPAEHLVPQPPPGTFETSPQPNGARCGVDEADTFTAFALSRNNTVVVLNVPNDLLGALEDGVRAANNRRSNRFACGVVAEPTP